MLLDTDIAYAAFVSQAKVNVDINRTRDPWRGGLGSPLRHAIQSEAYEGAPPFLLLSAIHYKILL